MLKNWILIAVAIFSTLKAAPFEPHIQRQSLLRYARSATCQYGEEGVIAEVLRRIGVRRGFFVEFGGYDGIAMSNTRSLALMGWNGAFIEPDDNLFAKMAGNFRNYPQVLCIKEFVTPFEDDPVGKTIDAIADAYFPGVEIDVMSIDIDGLDHLIFKNMKRRPKLIVIEGGMFWHPLMQLEVPDEIAARGIQQPIHVMTNIAQAKGYQLICSTFNAFFIRDDYYHLFAEIDNEPSRIWWEAMIHIKKGYPDFYNDIFRIRTAPWLLEWEGKDPEVTFPFTRHFCDEIIR